MTVRAAHIAAWLLVAVCSVTSPAYAIDAISDTPLLTKKPGAAECERMMNVQRQSRRAIEEFLIKALAVDGALDINAAITVRVSTRDEDQAIDVRRYADDFDIVHRQLDMHTILMETEIRHLVSIISEFMSVKYNKSNARMIDGVFELFVVQDAPKIKAAAL